MAVGDVPGRPAFSVAKYFMRLAQLVARTRAPEEPMFLAADGVRPYLYRAFAGELRDSCIKHGGTDQDLPHGLRVRGYNDSKSRNGTDITVVQGGWSENSDAHCRYDRFSHHDVLGIPAGMLGEPNVFAPADGIRPINRARLGRPRGGASAVAPTADEDAAAAGDATAENEARGSGDDEEGGAVVGDESSGRIPPGYSEQVKVAPSGRKYQVFFAPDGRRLTSMVQCWREYVRGSERASPLVPSPSNTHASLGSASENVAPEAASPAGRVSIGRTLARAVASSPEVFPSRRGLCNTPTCPGSNVLCSFPHGHSGAHDFELSLLPRQRRPTIV